jgi:hypothetical protein
MLRDAFIKKMPAIDQFEALVYVQNRQKPVKSP